MKKYFLLSFAIIAIAATACSGNRADEESALKDTTTSIADTSNSSADSLGRDTVGKDAYQDSTSNAPRLPGGN